MRSDEKIIINDTVPTEGEIKMGEVINLVSEKTRGEAILVSDVGQHQMMSARYYKFNSHDSHITSGGLGTMGFALPASFGAQLASERQVVAVAGDGGIQMTIQELGTIVQYAVPVKVIILNNNFLGMVRQWQQLFFEKRYASTELVNPNFTAIAQGYGMAAKRIDSREQLSPALDEMLAHPGPYFLEIKVETEENIFPMIPSGSSVEDIRLE